mmetsp:Transcript_11760/g.25448  ORF Transcript_11760/g.25448 Transcript_11760/m.25448 type:complete len:230 (-) Transcript_11760:972-1661(-)
MDIGHNSLMRLDLHGEYVYRSIRIQPNYLPFTNMFDFITFIPPIPTSSGNVNSFSLFKMLRSRAVFISTTSYPTPQRRIKRQEGSVAHNPNVIFWCMSYCNPIDTFHVAEHIMQSFAYFIIIASTFFISAMSFPLSISGMISSVSQQLVNHISHDIFKGNALAIQKVIQLALVRMVPPNRVQFIHALLALPQVRLSYIFAHSPVNEERPDVLRQVHDGPSFHPITEGRA